VRKAFFGQKIPSLTPTGREEAIVEYLYFVFSLSFIVTNIGANGFDKNFF
jgi:hypothetical protein